MKKKQPNRLEDSVVAAIEAGAKLRGTEDVGARTDPVERIIAIIESEAARLRGNDLSALNAVLAGQALALDTIFAKLAREAVEDDIVRRHTLALALKAQSQSRATLGSLVSFVRPRTAARPRRSKENSDEQTIAGGKSSSP